MFLIIPSNHLILNFLFEKFFLSLLYHFLFKEHFINQLENLNNYENLFFREFIKQ